METSYKCIPCFFRQIEITNSLIGLSAQERKKIISFLTRRLLQFDFRMPPVVFGRTIYKAITKVSNKKDIFAQEKAKVEQYLLGYNTYFEAMIRKAKDPLHMSARLSCASNAIDFGAGKIPDVKRLFSKMSHSRLFVDDFSLFKRKLSKARCIVVIGDNCAEAYFDKLFIEQIRKHSPRSDVYFVTRSAPIINDITPLDAKRLKLREVAKVISSGCDYPGIMLSKTSRSFKKIYNKADIVISKGQGNFESLYDKKKSIFYLFKIKCVSVVDCLGMRMGSLLFLSNKRATNTA